MIENFKKQVRPKVKLYRVSKVPKRQTSEVPSNLIVLANVLANSLDWAQRADVSIYRTFDPTTIGFIWSSHTSLPNLTKRSTDNLPNSESPSVQLVKHPWDLKVVVYCFRMRVTHFYTSSSSSSSLLVSLDSGHWRPSCLQIPASLLRLSAITRDMCQTSTPIWKIASASANWFVNLIGKRFYTETTSCYGGGGWWREG